MALQAQFGHFARELVGPFPASGPGLIEATSTSNCRLTHFPGRSRHQGRASLKLPITLMDERDWERPFPASGPGLIETVAVSRRWTSFGGVKSEHLRADVDGEFA